MPHIHTEAGQHDHTVSIYLFRTDFEQPKIMLHFHKKMNAVAQFGGHIELNETPWQTTSHELEEETGYTLGQLKVLQPVHAQPVISGATLHPYPVAHVTMSVPGTEAHYHTDSIYAFVTDQPPAQALAEGESTDIRLYSEEELVKAKAEIEGVTFDLARHIFKDVLPTWKAVPATDFKL